METALKLYTAAAKQVVAWSGDADGGLSASLIDAMMQLNARLLNALGEVYKFDRI